MYHSEINVESYNHNFNVFKNNKYNYDSKYKNTSFFSRNELPFFVDLDIIEESVDIISSDKINMIETVRFGNYECKSQMLTHSYLIIMDFILLEGEETCAPNEEENYH